MLLDHADGAFREHELAGSFSWNSTPDSARGPSLRLRHTLGARAAGGADVLLEHGALAGLGAGGNAGGSDRHRFEARFGYGFGLFGERCVGTPEAGLRLSETSREVSVGWRVGRVHRDRVSFDLGLEATRRDFATDKAPARGLRLRMTARW